MSKCAGKYEYADGSFSAGEPAQARELCRYCLGEGIETYTGDTCAGCLGLGVE